MSSSPAPKSSTDSTVIPRHKKEYFPTCGTIWITSPQQCRSPPPLKDKPSGTLSRVTPVHNLTSKPINTPIIYMDFTCTRGLEKSILKGTGRRGVHKTKWCPAKAGLGWCRNDGPFDPSSNVNKKL